MTRAMQPPGAAASGGTVIVDAGVGNLGNLRRAVVAAGGEAEISADPERIAAATCLLLPGVGAFRPPREALRGPIEEALRRALDAGAWLLGICVGFQLLFERGDEHGSTDGLSLLPGRVARLPGRDVALPHIGWNGLLEIADHPLMEGIESGDMVYFVHSFAPVEVPGDRVVARTLHGELFPSIVARDRVLGTQFHPEKSGPVGLALLRNYLAMAGALASGEAGAPGRS